MFRQTEIAAIFALQWTTAPGSVLKPTNICASLWNHVMSRTQMTLDTFQVQDQSIIHWISGILDQNVNDIDAFSSSLHWIGLQMRGPWTVPSWILGGI